LIQQQILSVSEDGKIHTESLNIFEKDLKQVNLTQIKNNQVKFTLMFLEKLDLENLLLYNK